MISVSVPIAVQFFHLDPMEVVWHGNYANFFEEARCALLNLLGYNYTEMRNSGFAWPVVDMRTKFIRPARFGQRIVVTATLAEYENRLKIDYVIRDEATGETLTKGQTIQVAVDAGSGEMCFESPAILLEKVRKAQCAS